MVSTEALAYGATSPRNRYDYAVVRQFTVMSLVFGLLGMVVGVYLAGELIWPDLGFDLPWLTFGRLRPVHTTLMVFGFCGNLLFAASYYVAQRTCQTRLVGGMFPASVFWGWQIILVLGLVSESLGETQARKYAEFEWPIALFLVLVWLVSLWVYVATLRRRKATPLYVANWFFLACFVGMALSYVLENLLLPVDWFGMKSYSPFSGVQSAMIQWWYGHNVITFLMNMAFLGMMYYFLPKQAGRPLYSYRLSVLHFWSLVFLSVWAAPNHLNWTALPDWTVTLGVTFSVMLLLPSLAGVVNGLMTLSGGWVQVRTDPVLRFMAVALVFYGWATLEGVNMSLQTFNALTHYTDWTIGHAHLATLGWVSMMSFGVVYHLVPRLWDTKLYSVRLVEIHFWIALFAIVLHTAALEVGGILQGVRLRALDEYGNLAYSFMETDAFLTVPYGLRGVGGLLFLSGVLIMVYNLAVTIVRAQRKRAAIDARIAAKLAVKGLRAREGAP